MKRKAEVLLMTEKKTKTEDLIVIIVPEIEIVMTIGVELMKDDPHEGVDRGLHMIKHY